jgi:hypothetical protein
VLPQPAGANWDEDTIRDIAQEVYEILVTNGDLEGRESTIVAAFWINCPMFGQAVYVVTIPHDRGDISGPLNFIRDVAQYAPRLYQILEGRTGLRGGTTLYHAEDMAYFWFEWTYYLGWQENGIQQTWPLNAPYPQPSFITTYGKYGYDDTVGFKIACGSGERINFSTNTAVGVRINVPCWDTALDLGVTPDPGPMRDPPSPAYEPSSSDPDSSDGD